MYHETQDLPDIQERPRVPHLFKTESHVCQRCGMSLQALVEFPSMKECTGVQATQVRPPEPVETSVTV